MDSLRDVGFWRELSRIAAFLVLCMAALIGAAIVAGICEEPTAAEPRIIESDLIRQYRASFHPRPVTLVDIEYFRFTQDTARGVMVMVRNDTLAFFDERTYYLTPN